NVLALLLAYRSADADSGVVDQDIKAPEAIAMALHDSLDGVLVGHVGGNRLHVVAVVAKSCRGLLQGVGLAGADRQRVAVCGERFGDRAADSTRSSRHDGGTVRHCGLLESDYREPRKLPGVSVCCPAAETFPQHRACRREVVAV